tara:strand:+ start:321 stop:680 length:360 start_codon:yes stop_codon:yes gene_type:complete
MGEIETDLRHGDWLKHVDSIGVVEAMITDPPYGGRTHSGDTAGAIQTQKVTGQKVRRVIDYPSFKGDRVLDPFAGAATTLIASREMGRPSVGFEIGSNHFNIGRERIDAPYQGDLWNHG